MEEIARYGAEDVCSSRDSGRLQLMDPLAVPNRYVGADFAVSKCPSRFSSTS